MPLTRRIGQGPTSTNAEGKAMEKPNDMIGNAHWRGWRLAVWSGATSLMILPILGMQISGATANDPGDFIFLAILVLGVGAIYELAARTSVHAAYRTAFAIAIGAILIQAWINLAVGVIGSENNPANLVYAGVIAVALSGAIAARLRASGMAYAMLATAVAQLLAFIAALIAGLGFTGPITIFFCAAWLISAWLFRRAALHAPIDVHPTNKEARQ